MPVEDVANALRGQWFRWGRPGRLRVGNGTPWGNWNDLPTAFALWVVGVGVSWHWNDPGCPQQNPKIERSQGTGKRWGEPWQCDSVAQLQTRLDEADRIHREVYAVVGGQSRLELFPELSHSGQRYSRAWEKRAWSLPTVEAFLSEYVAVRRVYASGHVSVYDTGRYVGKQYIDQDVQVQYDPEAHGWLIRDSEGRELCRPAAPEITRERIVKMSFRKKRHAKNS